MNLSEIVKMACHTHVNADATIQSILDLSRGNETVIEKLIHIGARTAMQEYRHSQRRLHKGKATFCARGNVGLSVASSSAEKGRQKSNQVGMLDMVVNGVRFGDMTGSDVMNLARNAHNQMLGNKFDYDFYSEVGRRAGVYTIRSVFTNRQLEAVRKKVIEEIEEIDFGDSFFVLQD